MSWQKIVFKNMTGNLRNYLGYLLSSGVAVMVYFLFALVTQNTDVQNAQMSDLVVRLLVACRWIVVLFAIFFITYFHAALLQMRQKEFGLFITIGIRPKQVGRMIFYESLFIGLLALLIGIVLGILFGKFFLLGMSSMLALSTPLPFMIPHAAISSTVILFGLVFVLEGFWTAKRLSKRNIKGLLAEARKAQVQPRPSLFKSMVALFALLIGYDLAVFKSSQIGLYLFPILIAVSIGTFLFFSQALGLILGRFRKRRNDHISLLIVSRLQHRIRDYSRILAVTTLLTAMVLTGMGSIFSTQQIAELNSVRINPFTFQILAPEQTDRQLPLDQVRPTLTSNGVPVQDEINAPLLIGNVQKSDHSGKPMPVWILSLSTFNRLTAAIGQIGSNILTGPAHATELQNGQAHFDVPYPLILQKLFPSDFVELTVGQQHLPLTLDGQQNTRVLDSNAGPAEFTLVLSDDQFQALQNSAPQETQYRFHGYASQNWRNSAAAIAALKSQLKPFANDNLFVSDTITSYQATMEGLRVTLFVGFFVSLLFFLASGSVIYFKLFTQVVADRRQFRSLHRMGFLKQNAGKTLTIELSLLFFVPFLIAVLHSTIAMVDFIHLMHASRTIWTSFAATVGMLLVCFVCFFLAARARYARQVWELG